jgi:hypothetical protein
MGFSFSFGPFHFNFGKKKDAPQNRQAIKKNINDLGPDETMQERVSDCIESIGLFEDIKFTPDQQKAFISSLSERLSRLTTETNQIGQIFGEVCNEVGVPSAAKKASTFSDCYYEGYLLD